MHDASRQSESMWRQATAPVIDLVALVKEHHAVVYRYACRLCGCPTEAEDLAQQTFVIAQQKAHQLREPARARAWLLAIVRSCFLKSVRKPRPVSLANMDSVMELADEKGSEPDWIDREALLTA